MASPIITPFAAKTETEYRPISRMAIIGLFLSCFSPLLFAVDNGALWLMFFVIPGAVISILARRSIVQSEGSLAGEPLAIVGVILAVACGLGWATSRLVSSYVNDMEARQTVDQWIAQMQRGEAGSAFLMTLKPKVRGVPFYPEDYQKLRQHFPAQTSNESVFDSFLVNPIYSQILRYRDRAHVTYVSQLESAFSRGTSFFRLKYHLETPIAVGDIVFVARSEDTETAQGPLRQWYVYLENTSDPTKRTHYGEELDAMTVHSFDQLKRFTFAVANGEMDIVNDLIDAATRNNADYKQLLGYLHPLKQTVLMRLMTPLRIRADEKTDAGWKLTLECTAIVMEDREVDFSLVASTDSTGKSKWMLSDFKFLGTHKLVAQIPNMAGGGGGQPGLPVKPQD